MFLPIENFYFSYKLNDCRMVGQKDAVSHSSLINS